MFQVKPGERSEKKKVSRETMDGQKGEKRQKEGGKREFFLSFRRQMCYNQTKSDVLRVSAGKGCC